MNKPVAFQMEEQDESNLHDTAEVSNVIDLKELRAQNVRSDGELINERYLVICKLEETEISTVYLAEDQRLARKVVLKHLHKTAPDMQFTELLREAQVLSMLNHPNILTVFDSTVDEKGAYIITEYVQGETIDKFSKKRGLKPELFVDITRQMLEGLSEAHHHGIIHGDIKPNNIMCVMMPGNRVQVKILDFGLANLMNTMSNTDRIGNNMKGSAYFMAPEQFENQPTTAQSDLYSLGCVCFQALCDRYPFNGTDTMQIMAAHIQHLVHDIATLRPDFPEVISQWVMWMINLRPDTRPESSIKSLEVLNQCFQEYMASPAAPQQPAAAQSPMIPTHTTAWQTSMTKTQAQRISTKGAWPCIKVQAMRSLSKLVSKQQAVIFMKKVMQKHGLATDSDVTPEMHRILITEYFSKIPNRAKQQVLLTEMEAYF